MSFYGAAAIQYKRQLLSIISATCVLDKSMISSSANSAPAASQPNDHHGLSASTDVEVGKDPLSDPLHQVDSLELSDYSFCNMDLKDCNSPKPGTVSVLGDTSDYYIPKEYPRHLGLDTEFQITGSQEPYVMADYNHRDEFQHLDKISERYPKGSLDLSAVRSPGDRMEQSLRTIPSIYPQLSNISDATIIEGPSSLEDLSPEKDENSPTSAFAKIDKPRSNPFKGDLASVKRSTSNVAYRDVVNDRGQNLQSGNRSPRRSRIPETSALAASTPGSINDDHTDRYEYIPPIPNLMKLKGVKSHGQTSGDLNQIDEMVTHLRGTINNAVQYIASLPGNNFETASSICFLGKFYLGKHQEYDRRLESDASIECDHGSFHDFLKDFQSRVWVTYRRGFACLQGTNLKSDTGWGCMLRTGQMMLATALQIHCFGRAYRRSTPFDQYRFKELVRHFGDSFDHPFSLQHLLKIGKEHLNKSYGEWYGPSTVAYVLRVCVDYAKEKGLQGSEVNIDNFTVFTATDCMVFKGDIVKTATKNGTRKWMKTLVLISVRMGADELNLSYRKSIQDFLMSPLCIGIMGGRKRHSLYFTGFQGNKLIHYDPHTCQTVLNMEKDFSYETYVCVKPRKMSFSKMDPSCTFGFYLQSEADLKELTRISESLGTHKIFELLEGTKEDYLLLVHDPSIKAFDHNESMFDEGTDYSITEIASLEGSDFEYLE